VGATISLGFECFSILIRASKIRFSFFFPDFFPATVGLDYRIRTCSIERLLSCTVRTYVYVV